MRRVNHILSQSSEAMKRKKLLRNNYVIWGNFIKVGSNLKNI